MKLSEFAKPTSTRYSFFPSSPSSPWAIPRALTLGGYPSGFSTLNWAAMVSSSSVPIVQRLPGLPFQHFAENQVGEQEANRVGALAVHRLVGERREHGSEALVCAFTELTVREDVQVVVADAGEHTLAALDRIHP